MMRYSPRLTRLLNVLLKTEDVLSVDDLAHILDSSRRTVFRELENAADVLSGFNLALNSGYGHGVRLDCGGGEKSALMPLLREGRAAYPCGKKERLLCLLLELLANDGVVRKLFFYADALGVCDATVSNDLDELEPYLNQYRIRLVRKPGEGIHSLGSEKRTRMAITMRLILDGEGGVNTGGIYSGGLYAGLPYPPPRIELGVLKLVRHLAARLDWMTEESRTIFTAFLMVSVARMQKGAFLFEPADSAVFTGKIAERENLALRRQLANRAADEIARRFSLIVGAAERARIIAQMQACNAK